MKVFELTKVSEHEIFPGLHVRFVHSASMTFAYWFIRAGADLPEHSHVHEQVAHMMEGEFELTVSGESKILTSGMVAVIPSNAVHSGRALTDCKIIDAFSPVREDYLARWL